MVGIQSLLLSMKNLRNLEIDLYTYVVDWGEFKDIQLSFLKASVPDGSSNRPCIIFLGKKLLSVVLSSYYLEWCAKTESAKVD